MSRKIGTSVVVTLEQMEWLDDQDDSISSNVRECIEFYRENAESQTTLGE